MAFVVNRAVSSSTRIIFNLKNATKNIRVISTSEKKKDGVTIPEALPKDIPDFSKPYANNNWVSYGFDRLNEKDDLDGLHSIAFAGITLCFIFGGFFLVYFPDFKERDWAQREGFLEIRRREALGLPYVDKNYCDPSQIVLPSDEELGDREIII